MIPVFVSQAIISLRDKKNPQRIQHVYFSNSNNTTNDISTVVNSSQPHCFSRK